MAVKSSNMWNFFTIVIIAGHMVSSSLSTPVSDPLLPGSNGNDNGPGEEKVRVRRYYVCPPDFERISNYCYYFSHHQATWQNAHYDCRDRRSELAVLASPSEDRKLKGQLNRSVKPLEWWIGGIYDWEQMNWKWISGEKFKYHGFSRMGLENREKLKWHCTIMDPNMKYKWSARSCVLGKHYICQTRVKKVGKKRLETLRKKYNNTLNEIPAPIYEQNYQARKPKKHENQANGYAKHNLKQYRPNGINRNQRNLNNAYGRRNNTELVRKGKERRNRDGRKNRRNNRRNSGLHITNGTYTNGQEYGYPEEFRKNARRTRRNKSKENNSLESATLSQDDLSKSKKKKWNDENASMEDITPKTSFMTNTLSPLHPRVIIEEHDFKDIQILNNS